MAKGVILLQAKQWSDAADTFKKSLNYNRLNDPNRAMVYWNLHVACRNMKDINCAAEALLGFIVYSTEYINSLDAYQTQKNHPGFIWIRKSKIEKRQQFAASLITKYWHIKQHENQIQ